MKGGEAEARDNGSSPLPSSSCRINPAAVAGYMLHIPPIFSGILFFLIIPFILTVLLAGCGKKGPPLPPETLVPEAVKDFKVTGKERGILVSWQIPGINSDGTPMTDLAGFKLYRRDYPEGCDVCEAADLPLYSDIDIEDPEGARIEGNLFLYLDTKVEEGVSYRYRVAPYNKAKFYGDFSDTLTAIRLKPPEPPVSLEAIAGDRLVNLKWRPPVEREGGFAGYNIYRGRSAGSYPSDPLTAEPVSTESFTDVGLENNRPYYYIVRSIAAAGNTYTEGMSSQEITAIPVDMIPPSAPAGVSAVPIAGGISLSWEESADSDLKGYFIYRKGGRALSLVRLNSEPLRGNHYIDVNIENGKEYVYSVTSVDESPQNNESAPSHGVSIKIPAD